MATPVAVDTPGEPGALPASPATPISAAPDSDVPRGTRDAGGLIHLPVGDLQPNPRQPRQSFSQTSLDELAGSIQTHGVMQPVVVRPAKQGGYEIVAGERRWRAAQIAGLTALPAVVREIDDRQSAEFALIENLQREDLNPIERAEAFHRLGDEFGLAQDEIADQVGLDRSTVSNLIRLLKLQPAVRQLVADNLLSMGHARALAGVADESIQLSLAERSIREGWSVRQIETAIRQLGTASGTKPGKGGQARSKSAWLADLERQIGEQLGTKVLIKPGRKKGAGTIQIDYYSLDTFDGILERLGLETESDQ